VYERALHQFTVAEIGEAFAAARGLALPSQLRRALQERGLDLHAQFIRLLPAPPRPVSIQRWNVRRVALWAVVLAAAFVLLQDRSAFTLNDESTTSLGIGSLGCRDWSPLWLEAQAVPSAALVPCVRSLPTGWSFSRADAKNGHARYVLDHDRAGSGAITASLDPHCNIAGLRPAPSGNARVRRYQGASSATTRTWYDIFAGGCATVTVHSASTSSDVAAQLAQDAPQVVGYASRTALRRVLADRSNGQLRLDPSAG
jgi:hypothetical protein